jgi:hypothetical protein
MGVVACLDVPSEHGLVRCVCKFCCELSELSGHFVCFEWLESECTGLDWREVAVLFVVVFSMFVMKKKGKKERKEKQRAFYIFNCRET